MFFFRWKKQQQFSFIIIFFHQFRLFSSFAALKFFIKNATFNSVGPSVLLFVREKNRLIYGVEEKAIEFSPKVYEQWTTNTNTNPVLIFAVRSWNSMNFVSVIYSGDCSFSARKDTLRYFRYTNRDRERGKYCVFILSYSGGEFRWCLISEI